MSRRKPDGLLTLDFKMAALRSYRYNGPAEGAPMMIEPRGAACWLKQHDPLDRPCAEGGPPGRLEAIHLISRQAIRRVLGRTLRTGFDIGGVDPADVEDLIELAEWDPRNAALSCNGHHRRLDSHATPELRLDAAALADDFLDFVLDWGLESEAEAKFTGGAEALQRRELEREGVAW